MDWRRDSCSRVSLQKGEIAMRSQNEIIQLQNQLRDALIRNDSDVRPRWIGRVTLDLTTAAAFNVGQKILDPFDSVFVEDATDDQVEIKIAFTAPNDQSFTNYVTLIKNKGLELEKPCAGAVLSWDAQSGKSITLVFGIGLKVKSGSFIQTITGGVTILEGTGFSINGITLTASTAVQIFAQDNARKVGSFVNLSGATIYVGDSGVDNTTGYPVPSGTEFTWRNTQELFGYSVAGTTIQAMEQS